MEQRRLLIVVGATITPLILFLTFFTGQYYQNHSCSMYPAIDNGDFVLVKRSTFSDISVNDTVVYSASEAWIEVEDQEFHIETYSEDSAVQTPVGEVKLTDVISSGAGKGARLSADGEAFAIVEGESQTIGGTEIQLVSVQGFNTPVIHRVVEKNSSYIQTLGDNNNRQSEFEKSVGKDQIIGKSFVLGIPWGKSRCVSG